MENAQELTVYDENGSELPLGLFVGLKGTTAESTPLSPVEQAMLENYETIIEQGEQTVIEVGQALSAINRGKLYRAEYGSFQKYCMEKWGFGRKRGYELINVGDLAEEVSVAGLHLESLNARQCRAVAKLKNTGERVQAFKRAKVIAGRKKVNSNHVERAVNEMLGTAPKVIDVASTITRNSAETVNGAPFDEDLDANGRAIMELLSDLRDYAESKEMGGEWRDIINELRRRISVLLKGNKDAQK